MLIELKVDKESPVSAPRDVYHLCGEHRDVATPSLIKSWIDRAEGKIGFLTATLQ